MGMHNRHFEIVETNGVRLRTVVEGDGPLVVLLHGFPQCWYLWRHQIDPLIAAGYRVAVPDQRGYGESSAPPDVADYGIRALCADVVGLAAALGSPRFKLIGHDWGCIVAWNTALLYPELCTAVMGMSVPSWRIGPAAVNPPGMDERFWYIRYFQPPAIAETELERDIERSLHTIYHGVSGDAPPGTFMKQLSYPRSSGLLDTMPQPPAELPPWLSRADLDYYVQQYRASGFRGPINWYRNMPVNVVNTPDLEGRRFTQPAAFAAGALDLGLQFSVRWREHLEANFDDLRSVDIIEGAGHWPQMEQPVATTASILKFLRGL